MDAVLLARIQFALTVGFHFLLVPLTIGLGWLIFWMMTRYNRTGDGFYRSTARFWLRVFILSFTLGVATGIPMEFQFGTNWSRYSRYVGDIFGAPLAAEGVFAFFLESTFLGVLVFGWDKVSRRVLWFSSLMVAVGATISAFWIIVANSWQQTPAGYHLVNGRAELADFWAAVFNPSSLERYFHTVDAAVMTGAFFVLGISAWFVLKGRHQRFAEESMRMALMVALVTSIAQVGFGHAHGVQVGRTQPEKLAAFEGLMETQRRAPALVFGIPDPEREIVHWDIGIPGLLSIFVYGNPNAEIKGLKAFPKDERPPVLLIFTTFHTMVGLGAYMILLALFGIHMMRCKTLCDNRIFLRLALWSIPVPFIANELGWVTAEVGRQPWIVYHLVKTQDAASPNVPAAHILASIIMFFVIYSVLFSLWFFLLRRIMEKGPEPYEAAAPAPVHPEVGA